MGLSHGLCWFFFLSVISGVGALDLDTSGQFIQSKAAQREQAKLQLNYEPDVSSPYLLLDLRDQEAYEQCHIITGKSNN